MELFQRILKTAVEGGASDVHLKIGTPVVYRINRQLVAIDCPYPTVEWMNKMVELVAPVHLKKRLEQEREIDFSYYIPSIGRFRTNLFQQRGQWCFAMRYVKTIVPSFEELGLLEQIRAIAESPRGIVLVAGSTGCGKSTTLAAMIEHINSNSKKHIITLEDPIEYVFEDNQCVVEQREVGLDTKSYSRALRGVVRAAPDVILIGEIRDKEGMEAAINLAGTGHLVLATLHANNCAESLDRIINMFPREQHNQIFLDLSQYLRAIMAQRLVMGRDNRRVAAVEIMINTPHIATLIKKGDVVSIKEAINTSSDKSIVSFDTALHELYKRGSIGLEEALANADSRANLEAKINFG